MILEFEAEHLSVKDFNRIELPELSVLTGLNGAGKTHILKAIENGSISVSGINPDDIYYYNLLSFRIKQSNAMNGQQIIQRADKMWSTIIGRANPQRQGRNWIDHSKEIYDEYKIDLAKFQNDDGSWVDSITTEDFYKKYQSKLESHIFKHKTFQAIDQNLSIVRTIKKCNYPMHLIDEFQFKENYAIYSQNTDHL